MRMTSGAPKLGTERSSSQHKPTQSETLEYQNPRNEEGAFMRASIFAGSILALGVVLVGCGGSSTDVEPTGTPAGTATVVVTRASDSNITPVSSGATTTATAAAETSTATAISTAEPTSRQAPLPRPPQPTRPHRRIRQQRLTPHRRPWRCSRPRSRRRCPLAAIR
jgi:hypothetical protein